MRGIEEGKEDELHGGARERREKEELSIDCHHSSERSAESYKNADC